ncbi:MAG: DUF5069 domain-containing protein [Verrucomicrobiaceae bacterium]|nr:DUF5069 domain-containing protein [Verrucomicrobiaceae bacterium]
MPCSDFTHPGNFPRSPRETLGGYVIAARTLDKCRASIAGKLGEYKFDCPLDNFFFGFTEITADSFREFVSTGADDDSVAEWIETNARPRERREIIQWNNDMRAKRICDLPVELQEFLEGYIPQFLPSSRPVYVWFDVYDIEEERT